MSISALKKAVVLCAGEGTRLRPLTFSRPKHLLPVGGQPLLHWALEALAEAGLEEVGLVVGHRPEAIQRYVGDGTPWGVAVTYLQQDKPLGLGHAVKVAEEFIGEDPFLLYLGDNLLEHGVTRLVAEFTTRQPAALLSVKEVSDPRAYGVAVLDGDQVRSLVEKPQHPPSHWAIVGAYAFHPRILEAIAATPPSARGEYEITDAIQTLLARGAEVLASRVEGFWEDAGRPAELLVANQLCLDRMTPEQRGHIGPDCVVEGLVSVGAGSRVSNCHLRGPCLIGENCVLQDSFVGPYVSLGSGCEVLDSRVENCIIQQDCRIQRLRAGLLDSVLGTEVEVMAGNSGSEVPLRLLLGDMSHIRAV
ncbi:MAG: glucose-1-phosphate thymidylyltransferase [candidate division WS1 bacterium]|nr:glucose-1-phosphate thymidylyltransferase [candidate division WS1 bacterium]